MATNFPTSLDSYTTRNSGDTISEDHMNNVQDAIEAIEAKVGITSSSVDISVDYKVNNFFVETVRKLWFYENTAPTGWTYASGITDQVIGVKGGSQAYNVNGGNNGAGAWVVSGLTKDAHTHSLSSHTHTHAEGAQLSTVASKTHHVSVGGSGNLGGYTLTGGSTTISTVTSTTGGPSTANSGAQSSSGVTSSGAWRPDAAIGIIATFTGA